MSVKAPSPSRVWTLSLLFLSVLIWAACLYRQQFSVLNEDVIWFLTAAGRLLDGGRFGIDVVEVNTPPGIMLYLPSVLLARVFGLSMALGHQLAVALIAVVPIALMMRILHPLLTPGRAQNWLWPLAQAAFIAFCVQIYQFGQRDNFVILFLLPFIALEAARFAGARSGIACQILAGVFIALALAIKPHYALVVLTLWGVRAWQLGLFKMINAADVRAAVGTGIAILILCFAIFPEWLEMGQLAWRYYEYLNRPMFPLLIDLLVLRWPLFGILGIALIAWWRLPPTSPWRQLMTALLLAWPGLALGYVLQAKGFAYHLIPLEAATELLGLLAVISILDKGWKAAAAPLGVSLALLAAVGGLTVSAMSRSFPNPDFLTDDPTLAAIRTHDTGNGMLLLDTGALPAIYAVPLYGTRIAFRSQCPWLLRPMVEVAVNGTGMAAEQARADIAELERGLVEDMISRQPDIVLVNEGPVLADGSSYVAYLSRNPAFAQAWSNYRLAASAMWGKKPIGIYVKASR
nr:hypothetical protein [uncultured Dongia sp.]